MGKGPLIVDFLKKCIVCSGYTYKVQEGYNGIGRYHENVLDTDVIEIEYTL